MTNSLSAKSIFLRYCQRYCGTALAVPCTGSQNLQMFPAMSKSHSELLQLYSNNESNADRIWKAAQQVWRSCSSSMVCRAFIHAYRIMQKIIENEGHNHWLVDGHHTVTFVATILTPNTASHEDPALSSICRSFQLSKYRTGQTAHFYLFLCGI